MTENNDYLALPESGKGPGLLVLHAWWGLNDFFKDMCKRLAAQGFVALAPDLYDGVTTTSIDEADQLSSRLIDDVFTTGEAISKLQTATENLQTHPAVSASQIGIVGFSLGGFLALEFAVNHAPQPISAVVLYYANRPGIEPQKYVETQASFLGHFAENDEFEPFDGVLETEKVIQQAGKSVTFHQYPGTKHWFAESNMPEAYNSEAADLAWNRTLEFLNETLKR